VPVKTRTTVTARRRGSTLAAELLFVLPVVLVVVLATIEFSTLLVVRQQLQASSREGARVAALGGDAQQVETAVRNFLGNGTLANAQVDSVLTDDQGQPLPAGAPVAVTVSIPTAQAVPNLLALAGFSIADDVSIAQTVMRKE
jgi:Flp pilus assembly protein TadG